MHKKKFPNWKRLNDDDDGCVLSIPPLDTRRDIHQLAHHDHQPKHAKTQQIRIWKYLRGYIPSYQRSRSQFCAVPDSITSKPWNANDCLDRVNKE
jgi:hypothetical protein